jgi:hypothetical protein
MLRARPPERKSNALGHEIAISQDNHKNAIDAQFRRRFSELMNRTTEREHIKSAALPHFNLALHLRKYTAHGNLQKNAGEIVLPLGERQIANTIILIAGLIFATPTHGHAVYTLIDFVSITFVALRNCCRVHRTTTALLEGRTKSFIAVVGTYVATRQFGDTR